MSLILSPCVKMRASALLIYANKPLFYMQKRTIFQASPLQLRSPSPMTTRQQFEMRRRNLNSQEHINDIE